MQNFFLGKNILGHEIIGIVEAASESAHYYSGGAIQKGDRITWAVYAYDHKGEMAKMGVAIVDRQMVLEFCTTSRVRNMPPVPIATVLTEVEWDAKRAQEEESQRILKDQKQR